MKKMIAVLGLMVVCVTGWGQGLSTGLISYWRLENSGGTVDFTDSWGSTNLTLINGTVASISGIVGAACQMNTDQSNFTSVAANPIALAIPQSTPYSVQAWIMDPGGFTGAGLLQDLVNETRFDVGTYGLGDGTCVAYFAPVLSPNDVYIESAPLSGSTWHHVLAVADISTGTFSLYVDGLLTAQQSRSLPWLPTNVQYGRVQISGAADETGQPAADEVAVWGIALTASDDVWLWNNGTGRTFPEVSGNAILIGNKHGKGHKK